MCPFAAVGRVGELLTLPLRLCKRCFPRKPLHPPAPHLSDASVPSADVDGFTHITPGFTFPRSVPTSTHLLCVITMAPGDWAPRQPAGQDLSVARTPAADRRLSLEVVWRSGVPFPWGGRPREGGGSPALVGLALQWAKGQLHLEPGTTWVLRVGPSFP